jgi:hypothetical protein
MNDPAARVPEELRGRYGEVIVLTDQFCAAHLDQEYRDLCRACAADACAAGVPVASGKAAGWAAGVISAVAYVNFLSDPERPFHMSPGDMAKRAGVSAATMQSKSKAVRDALDIDRLDPRYCIRELNEDNPFVWILLVNGMAMDIRQAPREAQEEAFRQGLIPYIPADGPGGVSVRDWAASPPEPARRTGPVKKKKSPAAGPPRVYTLLVKLLSGPITEAFAKKNRSVVRTIEMRGDQTLEDLHEAIFDAFDRDDPHMYEFQFGKKPMDPKGPRYVMPEAMEYDDGDPHVAGVTTETTLDDLGLKVGRHFGYWFDFGDDWHHQIDVVAIHEGPPKGKYPRVTKRLGESPPQYIYDEDEEE